MAPKNSMIDSDFIDGTDDEFDDKGQQQHERWTPPEPTEVQLPQKQTKEEKQPEIEVQIGDDTPEEDRGKWVADDEKDGEPDIPNEDEVRSYAKGAQKRIGQMTARIHAERRRADQLAREHAETLTVAQRLLQENNLLKTSLNEGNKVLLGEHRGRLQGALDAAKLAYKEAHEAGDAKAMADAQEQIASAIAKMERAAATQPQALSPTDEKILRPRQPQAGQGQPTEPDPKAVKWQERNAWFGRDDAMTGYALGLHKQMIERDGITPDQPEYYKTLDQEMRRRFPDRFRGSANGQRREPPPVGAVNRTGNGAAPRRVQITESQAKLAKRLGLTVEQYAQQLVLEEDQRSRDGSRSFTHT